jgi:hypothetical protein
MEKVPEIKPIQTALNPHFRIPDSTKKKQFDQQMNIRTKDGKTNIVMEFDDEMNLLSVKENGKELQGEKRKEYEKKAQALKKDKQKEEDLKKKEDELKIIQQKLKEKQKEMEKAHKAYAEASSEYYQKLYEMEGNQFTWFDDSGNFNAWTIPYDNFYFEPEELEKIQDQLKDVAWDQYLPAEIIDPSQFDLWDNEKLMDLYNDHLEDYEEVFKELEKVQKLEREELLKQIEELQKTEEIEFEKYEEFEKKLVKELVKDKVINSKQEFKSFRLSIKELHVNGEKQSKDIRDKYLRFFEEITGNSPKGTMQIIIED